MILNLGDYWLTTDQHIVQIIDSYLHYSSSFIICKDLLTGSNTIVPVEKFKQLVESGTVEEREKYMEYF